MATTTTPKNNTTNDAAFRKFDDYPWVRDRPFLQGLVAMLGPLSNTFERQKALGVTLQARIWWYKSRLEIDVDRAAYETWAASQPGPSADSALLDKIEDIQRRMGLVSSSSATVPSMNPLGGDHLPAWMVEAPQKVDPRKKADDGAAGRDGGSGTNSQEAPYPAHFQAIIEAVTMGKPVAGVKEIPNTVVRQAGILPVGKMQAPRKPWERPQQQAASPDENSVSLGTGDVGSGSGGRLVDEEFPPVADDPEEANNRPVNIPSLNEIKSK